MHLPNELRCVVVWPYPLLQHTCIWIKKTHEHPPHSPHIIPSCRNRTRFEQFPDRARLPSPDQFVLIAEQELVSSCVPKHHHIFSTHACLEDSRVMFLISFFYYARVSPIRGHPRLPGEDEEDLGIFLLWGFWW